MRVPWTARRSNQSILKEISPRCSLERLILKLKLQYFGHLMRRADSLEKTLMLGGIGGRRRGRQDEMVGWHHRLNGHRSEQTPGVGDGQGGLACCDSWGRKESERTEQLNSTQLNAPQCILCKDQRCTVEYKKRSFGFPYPGTISHAVRETLLTCRLEGTHPTHTRIYK